jgi:KDO2-lipid IV(A) lauroyltransferase
MIFLTNCLAYSLGFLAWILPKPFKMAVASFLAWLWFDVIRLRRFTILKNLTIAFPTWSKQERIRVGRRSMVNLCYHFLEFFELPFCGRRWLKTSVVFDGSENFEKARAQGKGVLILSCHVGSGDMAIAALAMTSGGLHVISKKFRNRFLNQLWFGVREKMGTRFIDPHGRTTAFDILRACRNKESVVFVIDQFMGKPFGIETTFFGRKTGTAYGLALFKIKTGAPVIPMFTFHDDQGKIHVVCEGEIPAETAEDRDLQIQKMTQKYNDKIEEIVRRHPEQWMWIHRRWKTWE